MKNLKIVGVQKASSSLPKWINGDLLDEGYKIVNSSGVIRAAIIPITELERLLVAAGENVIVGVTEIDLTHTKT